MTAAGEERDHIQSKLAAFDSSQWPERRDAVRWAGEALQGEDGIELAGLVAPHLQRLANDPSSDVRLAVAVVLPHLRHASFDKVAARLIDDTNAYVCRAAQRAIRSRKQETSVPQAEDGVDAIQRQVDRIKRLYSPEVAREAITLGEAYHEVYCADASHQILNVLTSLKGALKRLKDSLRDGVGDRSLLLETLDKARSRAEHLERIAEDLKAYAANVQPELHKENLVSMVHEALENIHDQFKGAQVAESLAIDENLVLDVPRHRLVEAFMNILKNSFEALGQKGSVAVSASVMGDGQIEIRFTDNGGGIPEEALADVFRPFATNKEGHTGYGLPIARKIIEGECGGTIAIESREGFGTTAVVRLPAQRE